MNGSPLPGILISLLLFAAPAAAQNREPDSPEHVLSAYMTHLSSSEFSKAAELMDPEELARFRNTMVTTARWDDPARLGNFLRMFWQVEDVPALEALSPEELFARFLQGTIARDPEIARAMRSGRASMLGHVSEAEDLVHVVYRLEFEIDGVPLSQVTVNSLRRRDGDWRLLLMANVETMLRALEKRRREEGRGK